MPHTLSVAATTKPLRVLVTNDDGIESEGLQVLARSLDEAGHDVVVVAPDRDYSGTGAALGNLRPDSSLPVHRVAIDGLGSDETWALEGPPALTVVAALLGGFGAPPEVVVSGINAGLNTGRSILHSGTVGAALTAQNFGLSALAVSLDSTDEWHWATAAGLAVETLDLVAQGPSRSVLNLNVPGCPRGEVRGTRWARLAPFGAVRARVSSHGDDGLQFELTASDASPAADTDQGTVQAGWASLTTLVGVAEAWPETSGDGAELATHLAPGADLHAVHQVPDASQHHLLRRPKFG
jgi:5'-nucleotidase